MISKENFDIFPTFNTQERLHYEQLFGISIEEQILIEKQILESDLGSAIDFNPMGLYFEDLFDYR